MVEEYYRKECEREWRRLARDPFHRLEFDTTLYFLQRTLPRMGLILDAGGGPGRYTIELGKQGYDVVLLDLTPELLDIARTQIVKAGVERKVKQVIQGSIIDLSMFGDNAFDGVICFGALGHVVDRDQREKAIDELIRVAKKGVTLFVSVIGRLPVLIHELIEGPQEFEISGHAQKIQDTGDYTGGYGFAPCHFYLPEELREAFERRKIRVLEMVGLEGLSSSHRQETNRLYKKYPNSWRTWWDIHLKTCTNPSVVGMSEHFLLICSKS